MTRTTPSRLKTLNPSALADSRAQGLAGDGLLPMRAVWMSAAWQALTMLVADGVSLAVDWKFHGIDYFSCWVRDMRRFLAYMLVVATLGGTLCAPWSCA